MRFYLRFSERFKSRTEIDKLSKRPLCVMSFWQWIWSSQPEEVKQEQNEKARAVIDELNTVLCARNQAARAECYYNRSEMIATLSALLAASHMASGREKKVKAALNIFAVLCTDKGKRFVRDSAHEPSQKHGPFALAVYNKLFEFNRDGLRLDVEYRILFPGCARMHPFPPVNCADPPPPWDPMYVQPV